mgnify:CR=1 FL=1
MPINPTTLKALIDTQITNETVDFAITPNEVGSRIKDAVDYTTEQKALSEVLTNKSTNVNLGTSDTLYPTQKAVKTYTDSAIGDAVFDINQDLSTLNSIKESLANKSTNVTTDGESNTKYPSVKAVKDYVDANAGGISVVKNIKVSLTSPQILNLFSTPLTIIPAVTGKVLIIANIFQKYTHISSPYTSNTWRIGYNSQSFGFVGFSPVITSADNAEGFNPVSPSSSTSGLTFIGLPLVLGCQSANPSGGDGTLDLYITYYEITI